MSKDSSYSGFSFEITAKAHPHHKARCGLLCTPHGVVSTPNFIFCATRAAIRGLSMLDMQKLGAEIVLGNTYHLLLRPGPEELESQGGLQKFTRWQKPMLTDSGGFQVFSLGHGSVGGEIKGQRHNQKSLIEKINDEGVVFRSHIDGKKIHLTPEYAIEVQRKIGADLILVLDECTPYHVDKIYTEKSMELSHAWGRRSLAAFQRGVEREKQQALYGIVQGGVYSDLRQRSIAYVNGEPFFGHAIGGCLGGSEGQMRDVVSMSCEGLTASRPVHLLGIGDWESIFHGVKCGIDTFDCVSPTRIARHGWALKKGRERRLNLHNRQHRSDHMPIDADCDCPVCVEGYSRAYLHHLFRVGESTGGYLLTLHNVRTMVRLMQEIQKAIPADSLEAVEHDWLES